MPLRFFTRYNSLYRVFFVLRTPCTNCSLIGCRHCSDFNSMRTKSPGSVSPSTRLIERANTKQTVWRYTNFARLCSISRRVIRGNRLKRYNLTSRYTPWATHRRALHRGFVLELSARKHVAHNRRLVGCCLLLASPCGKHIQCAHKRIR